MKRIVVILLCMALQINSVQAQPTLVLGNSHGAPLTTPDKDGLFDLIYLELAKRLGINIVIQATENGERALLNANSGLDDGDVARVAGLDKRYSNLVYLPVPVYHYQMVVFSKSVAFPVDGAKSIAPYDIGVLTGWKVLENIAKGARSVTSLDSAEQLFSMLDKQRIDIALMEKTEGLAIIKKLGIKNIRVLQPNLLEGDWYLYLNKKHAAMVPKIAAELEKMHKDGTIRRINETVGQKYQLSNVSPLKVGQP
jgi:polar amino acid transport system substrate-binding protein